MEHQHAPTPLPAPRDTTVVRLLKWLLAYLAKDGKDQHTPEPTIAEPSSARSDTLRHLNKDWLRDFYRECGREVTLAYTTLNQMKNWAIVVDGAIIAAVGAIARYGDSVPQVTPGFALFLGASIALVFTLRYYVRAILCYINLVRWNTLQQSIVKSMLLSPIDAGADKPDSAEELVRNIRLYYHSWNSPIDRSRQIMANLKLGFALLLALPSIIFAWGVVQYGTRPLAAAAVVFVLGNFFIEANDFFGSSFFDDPKAAQRRRDRKDSGEHAAVFPRPRTSRSYIIQWIGVVLLSVLAMYWPELLSTIGLGANYILTLILR